MTFQWLFFLLVAIYKDAPCRWPPPPLTPPSNWTTVIKPTADAWFFVPTHQSVERQHNTFRWSLCGTYHRWPLKFQTARRHRRVYSKRKEKLKVGGFVHFWMITNPQLQGGNPCSGKATCSWCMFVASGERTDDLQVQHVQFSSRTCIAINYCH